MLGVAVCTVGLASARIIVVVSVRRGAHTLIATSPHTVSFRVLLQCKLVY